MDNYSGRMDASVTDGQIKLQSRGGRKRGLGSPRSDLALFAATAIVLVCGLLLFYGRFYSVHQDVAGSALSGRLAVTLGASFRDYSIYFPPAEKFWFSLAAQLSNLSGLRIDLVVALMTSAAVLFSTGLAYRIRSSTGGTTPLFFILSVAVLTLLPILYKNVFGLREHMVALGMWPYLVLRFSDPDGTRIDRQTRAIVGLWLGAMLLFKYLYSVVVALIELADAVVQRRSLLLFRAENVIAGAVVVFYLFTWLGLDPSQRAAIGAMSSAIDANLADARQNMFQVAFNLYFAMFFLLAYRAFHLPGRPIAIGLALVVGAVIVAWAQKRWYSHHMFAITMSYVAWWWLSGRGLKWWAHAVVALYLAVPIRNEFRNTAPYQEAVGELDEAMSKAGLSVSGKRVGILTMHPSPYNQYLAERGAARWNPLMNNAYVASELKPFDRPENALIAPPPVNLRDPGRRMLHDEMLRLWEDMPPDVLILDHSTRWPLHYIDVEWSHVFSEDRRLNEILRHYRPALKHKGKNIEFQYLVRAD